MQHNFKKKFGQNFITDINLLNSIVKDSKINGDSFVLEIGAGQGTLTEKLASVAKQVISFEIDKELKPYLLPLELKYSNLKFYFEDFIKTDLKPLINDKDFCVVANLPYYITTQIILKLLSFKPSSITVMVQNEVADRLLACPKNKDYRAMTVICKSFAKITKTRVVSKNMFYPMPKVDSAILHFDFYKKEYDKKYVDFVNGCFALKRKTLVNNLASFKKLEKQKVEDILKENGFKTDIRAEELDINDFEKLYKLF